MKKELVKNDGYTFFEIKKIINELFSNKLIKDKLTIAGGIAVYLNYGEISRRTHGDLDCICNIKDIQLLKEFFINKNCYNHKYDSFIYECKDYGFIICYKGLEIGVYPFKEEKNNIVQYSYDFYNKKIKKRYINIQSNKYINNRKFYNLMAVEVILKSKIDAYRVKDKEDIKIICNKGFDNSLYKEINIKEII